MEYQISPNIKRYFWDIDFSKLDFKKHGEYIIARILEYGDPEAIKWLFETYHRKTIKKVLMNRRGFSNKTANFWSKILDIDKNQILCLKKSYQETHKNLWPY